MYSADVPGSFFCPAEPSGQLIKMGILPVNQLFFWVKSENGWWVGWFILIEVSDEGSWFYYMYIQPGYACFPQQPCDLSVRCPILVDDFSCGEKVVAGIGNTATLRNIGLAYRVFFFYARG